MYLLRLLFFSLFFFLVVSSNFNAHAKTSCDMECQERKNKNSINIGVTHFPQKIDPYFAWHYQAFLLSQLSYETLVRLDENGNLISSLSERWTISEDGKIYTFFLSNTKFHNNDDVTAYDVARSISRHFCGDSISTFRDHLEGIVVGTHDCQSGKILDGIEIVSKRVVKIKLTKPYEPFLNVLAATGFAIVGKDKYIHGDFVGSGPMVPLYDVKNKIWVFSRFKGLEKYVKKIFVSYIGNKDKAEESIVSGKLDLIIGPPSGFSTAKKDQSIEITTTESLAFFHLFFNTQDDRLASKKLRKEIGIKIQEMAKASSSVNFSKMLTFQPYLIPNGIMLPSYYLHSKQQLENEAVQSTQIEKVSGALVVMLREEYFSKTFGAKLKSVLDSFGFQTEIIFINAQNYVDKLKSGYGLISSGAMFIFPDPDPMLGYVLGNRKGQYGSFGTKFWKDRFYNVRHQLGKFNRLKKYEDILLEFQKNWYVVPLYRLKIPFFHRGELVIPDTSYNFECELSRISWRRIHD